MACASVVSPIEIFAADEVGRRRQWSDADKIQIVEESLLGYRQGSTTARRYGISRSLLSIWRREYRSGTLGAPEAGGGFVPLVMESPPPEPEERPSRDANDSRIDITLTNGRRMTIPALLAPSQLAALLAVLDPR
ncbi:IS66-like element accessory protein TnpA [Agrobacterium pusense]|uniref:IS66-like element accessory protein TnpA n=1 Tax=Agrobacterium pusense TaxID=648995 RepID=UPI00155FC2F1|nr:transposase [Agrobacterium pusense]NRF11378.1 transposase [Agrobacterium pusense]